MIYQFSEYIFDAGGGELRRRGEAIPTEPQALKVLGYLIAHRHRVVSRDELFEQCWPDSYVSDSSLTSCLSRLRQALGQTRAGPMFIQTLHRRGYRFVAEVTEADESAPVPAALLRLMDASAVSRMLPESEASPPLVVPPPVPLSTPDAAATAGRRPLSVLSCTLAEVERLALHLDAEDHYELMQRFRTTCGEIMAPYGGHMAQQSDAGLTIYFGYPQAYEDAALRAVHSALALTRAVRDGALDAWAGQDKPLAVRVGIATGMMIVRSGDEPAALLPLGVGRALRLAMRLGVAAAPGTVVISDVTARLVRGFFTCKVLEDVTLSGIDAPLAYEVSGASALQSRLEVESVSGLTPYVGREAEIALLEERWRYVQEGLGQVVIVHGEAGMGKSRLVQVWQEQVGDALPLAWICRCSPHHQHTALSPLIELLHRALSEASSPSPAAQLESLEALLGQHGFDLAETVPLLADLVALPLPASRYTPLNLTPQRQRERTLETLVSLLVTQAAASPLLFVVEDLHWADPSTLEFLALLMQQAATVSLLVVLTCRPQFAAPWEQRTTMAPVVLQRLTRPQTEAMIQQVATAKPLPPAVVAQLVEKTDGVPLFVEELTRMVLESGQLAERDGAYSLRGDVSYLAIPATLHDSLLARLDRLGVGKDIAQWGSVLGREFSYEVLAAVTPYDESTLQVGLQELLASGLVFQRGLLPQTRYRFKHALLQDAAYDALLKRRRQAMHGQIADVLAEQFADDVETHPEWLAHHYTAAGRDQQAVHQWKRAGEHAIARSAYVEASAHLHKALEVLARLPDTPQRSRDELQLQVALGPVVSITEGSAAPEHERVYRRALELSQRVGDTTAQFNVLWGLWRLHQARADLLPAREIGEQCLRLAESQSDPLLLLRASYALGASLLFMGDFSRSQMYSERVIACYRPQYHVALRASHGVDLGVLALCYTQLSRWMLGYPDQALQQSQRALDLARGLGHNYSVVYALHLAASLHRLRRDPAACRARVEEMLPLAHDLGTPQLMAWGAIMRGWVLAVQGEVAAGITQIQDGLNARQTRGMGLTRPMYLAVLAEAYGQQEQPEAGLRVLAEALNLVAQNDERYFEAELHRLDGELRQQAAGALPVMDLMPEVSFHRALDIARQQQAKSLELRAATSLARLWQTQGKRQEAYDLLQPVYRWFTEGFDTADLKDARALLDELGEAIQPGVAVWS